MARRPFSGPVNITQEYGVRGSIYRRGYHTGVDYGLPVGTQIVSPTNGTIVENGDGRGAGDGRGFFIVLKGDDGVFHQLFHLKERGAVTGRVTEGQPIGLSGNTGLTSGPHLHWETTRANDRNSDFAPSSWLFAGQPVYTPPVVRKQYVRLFGDYRTLRVSPGGAEKAKIYPSRFGGHLDYPILERSGAFVKIPTQMFGEGWIYVGADVAHLTQYYNA